MAGLVFGLSWLVPAIHALRCLAVQISPGLDPGPRKTKFGGKKGSKLHAVHENY